MELTQNNKNKLYNKTIKNLCPRFIKAFMNKEDFYGPKIKRPPKIIEGEEYHYM